MSVSGQGRLSATEKVTALGTQLANSWGFPQGIWSAIESVPGLVLKWEQLLDL
jgi:hypothetical protein